MHTEHSRSLDDENSGALQISEADESYEVGLCLEMDLACTLWLEKRALLAGQLDPRIATAARNGGLASARR